MNETAVKWYRWLDFPAEYDEEFYRLADEKDISSIPPENAVNYLCEKKDYGLSLIYFLSRLDSMKAAMDSRGIDGRYFRSTASELIGEALSCKKTFGALGVYEGGWFNAIMKGEYLFRIGRLNFGIENVIDDWCSDGETVKVGDCVIVTHIPSGGRLDNLDAYMALAEAERFFLKYFPERSIKCFICGSWLLDRTLDSFLRADSNIIKFRELFTPYMKKEDYSAIKFAFGKNVNRENLADFVPKNSFQEKLKNHILSGGKLYDTFGTRPFHNEDIQAIDCHYHQMQWFSDDMSSYPPDYIPECDDTGSMIDAAAEYMERCNLQGLNILCMPNMEDLFRARDNSQNILGAIVKCENDRAYSFGSLIYPEFPAKGNSGFEKQAKALIDMGFDGIKLIETKPNAHNKVKMPICSVAYDELFNYLEENDIHVLCHVNDPVFCWDKERVGSFDGRFAHYETIYSEVFERLNKNPGLKITFAHCFFMGYDIDRLAAVLDKYPNVCIDITPGEEELGFMSRTPEKAREFFVKYSERIMLGTDSKNAFSNRFKDNQIARLGRFLKTGDTFRGMAYDLCGLALGREELENILYKNFKRRTGEQPKKINKAALKAYIEKMLPDICEGRTKDAITDYMNKL